MQALIRQARAIIGAGSKSFAFASAIFDHELADSVALLYWWCRYADDQVDAATSPTQAREQLARLRADTEALYGPPVTGEASPRASMRYVVERYAIPPLYPRELVAGMAMDVEGTRYETLADLHLYCYRVAGVVGGMMAHIVGLSDAGAMRHAIALGHAFQLTNIARDVLDDAAMGRVYIPAVWLREHGVTDVRAPEHRLGLVAAVDRLLVEADRYYADARPGLLALPLRTAFAIAVALRVYRAIGASVRARGTRAWETRARVPAWRKVLLAIAGVCDVLLTLPKRRPFRRAQLG